MTLEIPLTKLQNQNVTQTTQDSYRNCFYNHLLKEQTPVYKMDKLGTQSSLRPLPSRNRNQVIVQSQRIQPVPCVPNILQVQALS